MNTIALWLRNNKGVGAGILTISLIFGVVNLAGASPAQDYWLTSGDNHQIFIIRNNAIFQTISTPGDEYPIAIGATARTFQGFDDPSYAGREYSLDGTPTGTTYPNDGTFSSVWDGTTDGQTSNYGLPQCSGEVVRYDRNWANPSVLFDFGDGDCNWGGITFDAKTHTIWINNRGTSEFRNYDLNGTLLSSFTLNGTSVNWGLAYDATTDTLWCLGGEDTGNILQISKTGVLLETDTIPNLGGNILGGEIVPPPDTIVNGTGTINSPISGQARFYVNAFFRKPGKPTGSVDLTDNAAGFSMSQAKVTSLSFNGNCADVSGTAKIGRTRVTFTVTACEIDPPGTSSFAITISNGYSASGNVTSGNILVH